MWYRTGTLSLTINNSKVTGTGTKWADAINGVMPGMMLLGPDWKLYEIKSVESNTALTLASNYLGVTASGQAYAIITTYEGDITQFSARFSTILTTLQGSKTELTAWLTGAGDVKVTKNDGTTISVPTLSKIQADSLSTTSTVEQRVVGPVLFSRPTRLTSGAAGPLIPDSQGTWALWGRAAGRGSTDFVNHRGNGSGGYWFYDTDGTTITALTYINNLGDLTTIGTLTSTGDQTIKASAATPNLLLRFRDSAGAEKNAIYAQTDVGVINIRWGGTAYSMQGRADGFVSVPFGHTLASALTTPASVISKLEGLGSSPFHFRGSGSDANFNNPASYSIGTYYGFSVVPTISTGLSEGVAQGKPVFFVNARTGTASVLNNMYIGSTAVLKTGDYGLGSTVQNNSSNINIDTALAVGFYSGSGFTSTAGMPSDWPTGTTHGYLVVENLAVSYGTACKQTLTSHPGSQFKPKTWFRLQRAGVWDSWQLLWDTTNTTVDANGFIKKASPIVKLFGNGKSELNDESQGVTTERISAGVYRVSGVLGFNGDGAWGGAGNGIEIPVDDNKRALVWVESKVLPDGDIEIRTYHRTYDTGPYSARNIEAMDSGEEDKKKPWRNLPILRQKSGAKQVEWSISLTKRGSAN